MFFALRHEPGALSSSLDPVERAMFNGARHDVEQAALAGGVRGALACLNARTANRFTGVYPLGAESGFGPVLYDRDNPDLISTDFRELASVCSKRVTCGPPSVISAAVIDANGSVRGTLCHFDARLRASPPIEYALLHFIATNASMWLCDLRTTSHVSHAVTPPL